MYRIHTHTLLCAFVALSMLLMLQTATAETIFFADFEDGSGVNDVSQWVPENKNQKWEIADFPGTGKGLKQTVEGCGNSGNTPLPGVTNFSDGVIQLDMSWADDDSWGVVLRQSAPDKGYLVVFGYNETPAVIVALLDKGCAAVGKCLDQSGCENNPANTLIQVDHGLGAGLTQDLSVAYRGRIEAIGDTIKVWYLPRDDAPANLKAKSDEWGDPLVEIKDGTHASGAVGIWQESQGGCMIDNVWVHSGPVAVDTQGKLAASWGSIKASY
ncbi:MAG: hypothetical protein ACE5PV_19195 [Candidatus Poribacteria bacterium]